MTTTKREKCWLKTSHEQCCCNCEHNWQTAKGPTEPHGPKCDCYGRSSGT